MRSCTRLAAYFFMTENAADELKVSATAPPKTKGDDTIAGMQARIKLKRLDFDDVKSQPSTNFIEAMKTMHASTYQCLFVPYYAKKINS